MKKAIRFSADGLFYALFLFFDQFDINIEHDLISHQ